MIKRLLLAFALLGCSATTLAVAQSPTPSPAATPKPPDQPEASETTFVQSVQSDLMARFPTVAQAEAAGFFRYSREDKTGAISYATSGSWTSDQQHPSQLWYDAKGNLIGADFSQPYDAANPKPPQLWGIDPRRWGTFPAHIHFVTKNPDGTLKYEQAVRIKPFTDAGGSLDNPTPAALEKATKGKVAAATVTKIFTFPAIWDLQIWVKPNPNGAFADYNPSVKPAASPAGTGM